MYSIIFYVYLIILGVFSFYEPKYIIRIDESNPKHFRINLDSNKDLSGDIISISESCFYGGSDELKIVKKMTENFPEEEKELLKEYGLIGTFYIDEEGKIFQLEFRASKEPTLILSLIAKVEKHYKSEFQIENSDCKIEKGKFVITHMAFAIHKHIRN